MTPIFHPDTLTSMIPDQFTSLVQVTEALRLSGLESCNLIIGIDCTKSNEWSGKCTFEGQNLHDIDDPSARNPYEDVIETIGRTLRDFDNDNVIPVYGFGDEITCDRAVFTFAEPNEAGFPLENIRERYREVVRHVNMAGPTSFAPIINEAVNIVNRTGDYHILVIIADGQVTRSVDIPPHAISKNEKETIDAITFASNFPLSIIMVGVGDGPWESMIYFDDYLLHRKFDNFHFIEYHKITWQFRDPQMRETQFALQALMEIPDQYQTIKAMNYLNRHLHRVRTDLPRVDVFPPPQSIVPNNYSIVQSQSEVQQVRNTATSNTTIHAKSLSTSLSDSVNGSTMGHRKSSAEEELRRLKESLLCPICEERKKDTVFQCGHETCEKCADFLSHCHLCRQQIQVRIKRFG
ncbi:copinelike protein [Plasmopara halstedii]|uniref:Copinelike protein n=1 Tax=Plasmopara halstedii TaxID=4781 RepID=A0A0P1AEN6_PLAHL|nr:copinelike protein [Plasmopara halstedii]CEG39385.1 copinelike protein [Plasmopara halstedii]|eukprot:XP_024575754.1 copinelike protein [Plasmopara halstedii]